MFQEPEVQVQRRKFTPEFTVEAARLVRDRGVLAVQAARDLDVHVNVLRKWVKEFSTDGREAFEQQNLCLRLRRFLNLNHRF